MNMRVPAGSPRASSEVPPPPPQSLATGGTSPAPIDEQVCALPNPAAPADVPNATTEAAVTRGKADAASVANRLRNHIDTLGKIDTSGEMTDRQLANAKQALRDAEKFLQKHHNDARVGPLHTKLLNLIEAIEVF